MRDLEQGGGFPWFSSYDKGVPHEIVLPEGGLGTILDNAAASYGQRDAVVFQNNRISYSQLKILAETVAASLRKRGVQPGETAEQAVERLLRENKELHEANYILRKALGFMAGR